MNTKMIALFIAGAVFTAGLITGFGGYVFAAENYNSSKSNTVTSIAKIHEHVGNILLPYGVGGMEINRVNDALDVGITADALKVMLGEVLGNAGSGATSEAYGGGGGAGKVQAILLEFDKIGIGEDGAQEVPPVAEAGGPYEISTPDAGGAVPSPSADGILKDLLPSSIIKKSIEDLKAAESKERRENIRKEIQANRETLQEGVQTLRQDLRSNAKDLRENFRENMRTTIGHVDHGKTGRIALAHGKGLRMVNRYRSAIARFDHILGRLESRIEKIGIEAEAQARSSETGTIRDILPSAILLIEEAKNMQALNKAKLAELEAKYESMLTGKNPGETAQKARAIAKELKAEIENLHAKLHGIPTVRLEINLR